MGSKSKAAQGRRHRRVIRDGRATELRARHPPQTAQSTLIDNTDTSNRSTVSNQNTLVSDIIEAAKEKVDRHRFWNSVKQYILDLEEDPTTQIRVFPRFAILFLVALTFYSRYLMLNGFEAMGMIHPDETYQAIEVAHAEVYGYGFQPYDNDTTLSIPRMQSTNCLRPPQPWLYTNIYTILFEMRELFGWTAAPFIVARNFHGLVAATLPIFVYKFTRTVFSQCRDIAFVATVLVAFSKHLLLFGVHPFLQSFISPVIFLTLTVMLRIIGSPKTGVSHADNSNMKWVATSNALRICDLVGLFACGFVFGLLIILKIDAVLIVVLCSPFLTPQPSKTASYSSQLIQIILSLTSGTVSGMAIGAAGDFIQNGNWFETPLRTVEFLTSNSTQNTTPSSFSDYLQGFIVASHVHVIILCAAVVVSAIYLTYSWHLTDLFNGWLGVKSPELPLFHSTFKMFVVSSILLLFYSVQNHREVYFAHDVIVLLLIAGAAAIYLLYRGLYMYILLIAEPQRVTKNIVKLILYAELFLYMFESRVTFPTAQNGNIANWSFRGLSESAYVNRCLMYVGQQADITGILIDYPVQMTGGFSLLHQNVPIYGKNNGEFREWGMQRRVNLNGRHGILDFVTDHLWQHGARINDVHSISLATLNEVTDFISIHNIQLLTKRLLEDDTYNYVIVGGGHKFVKKGFREVFNASDTRVYKRSKSIREREYLIDAASKIPISVTATIAQYEGWWLVALKLYIKAIERLEQSLRLDPSKIIYWKLLMYTLHQTKQVHEEKQSRDRCFEFHGSRCNDKFDLSDLDPKAAFHQDVLEDLEKVNVSYKFHLPGS